MFKIFFSGLILFHDSAAYLVKDGGHKASIEFKAPTGGCGSFTVNAGNCVLAIEPGQILSFDVTGAAPTPGMFFERLVPNLKQLAGTDAKFAASGAAKVELKGGTLDPYGFATVCSYTTPGSTSQKFADSVGTIRWTLPASVTKLKLTVTTAAGVSKDYEVPAIETGIWVNNDADSPNPAHFDHYLKMAGLNGSFKRTCHDPFSDLAQVEKKDIGLGRRPFIRLNPVTCPPAVFP